MSVLKFAFLLLVITNLSIADDEAVEIFKKDYIKFILNILNKIINEFYRDGNNFFDVLRTYLRLETEAYRKLQTKLPFDASTERILTSDDFKYFVKVYHPFIAEIVNNFGYFRREVATSQYFEKLPNFIGCNLLQKYILKKYNGKTKYQKENTAILKFLSNQISAAENAARMPKDNNTYKTFMYQVIRNFETLEQEISSSEYIFNFKVFS